MFDVVGIGESVVDLVGVVRSMPKENSKKDVSSFKQFVGGRVVNSLLTLSALGAKTSFIGTVGTDSYGTFIKHILNKNNVQIYNLRETSYSTPFHFVLISKKNQSRTIFKSKSLIIPLDELSEYHKFTIKNSRVLSIDRHSGRYAVEAAKFAHKNNVWVSFDPSDKNNEFIKKILKITDILIAPLGFLKHLKNKHDPIKAIKELWSGNRKYVVITLGPNGCIATDGKSIVKEPRYNKVKVVDTNGAGDVFHGAFVYGIIRKWSLGKACEFANKIAALKCSILGNNLKKLDLYKYVE